MEDWARPEVVEAELLAESIMINAMPMPTKRTKSVDFPGEKERLLVVTPGDIRHSI